MKRKIKKILKTFLKLLMPVKLKRSDGDECQSLDKLSAFHPDVHKSCIREKPVQTDGKYDLDIIIPAYNVEKYVRECLESVVRQKTDFSFRAIVIDDGSTDNTGKIIDEFSKYENFKIVHQENKGHSGSRNAGLKLLESKYVMFVDSDDLLYDEHSIDSILKKATQLDADIVHASYIKFNRSREIKFMYADEKMSVNQIRGHTCFKAIRSKFFKNVKFPEQYWYEDSIMRQIIFDLADSDKLYGSSSMLYRYRYNPSGVTATGTAKPKSLDSLWVTFQLHEDRKKLGLKNDDDYYDYLIHMAILTYQRISLMPEDIKKAFFIVYSGFIKKNFEGFTSKQYKEVAFALKNNRYLYFKLFAKLNLGG